MSIRPPRILDAYPLADLLSVDGHEELSEMLDDAEAGWYQILLPTTAIADAETQARVGRNGWDGFC